jgi:hypothetical protein
MSLLFTVSVRGLGVLGVELPKLLRSTVFPSRNLGSFEVEFVRSGQPRLEPPLLPSWAVF